MRNKWLRRLRRVANPHYPYVFSKRCRREMARLAKEHGLSFTFNPGGGEFYNQDREFRCQITCCDDRMDYRKLKKAVKQLWG